MKLIVGLGNTGTRYVKTRHNIGFRIVDELVRDLDSSWGHESKLKADIAIAEHEGEKLILAKPDTMMNLSGESVQRLMQFYKLRAEDVWVIFDDLDVPFGRLRLRLGGSSGGHQGLNSTIAHIGPNFVRVRVGISLNDRATEPSEVYVLKPFNPEEQTVLPELINQATDLLEAQFLLEAPEESTFDLTN